MAGTTAACRLVVLCCVRGRRRRQCRRRPKTGSRAKGLRTSLPSEEPLLISARTRSPAAMCGTPSCAATRVAYVPLPTPGGPRKTQRTAAPLLLLVAPSPWAAAAAAAADVDVVENAAVAAAAAWLLLPLPAPVARRRSSGAAARSALLVVAGCIVVVGCCCFCVPLPCENQLFRSSALQRVRKNSESTAGERVIRTFEQQAASSTLTRHPGHPPPSRPNRAFLYRRV